MASAALTAFRRWPWWAIKIALSMGIVAGFLASAVGALSGLWPAPIASLTAQALVVSGGAITLWHYRVLSRARSRSEWARGGGLYRYIRHPMYLGDGLTYLGIALLWSAPLAAVLYVGFLGALVMLIRQEEQQLLVEYGEAYADWQRQTWALLPGSIDRVFR